MVKEYKIEEGNLIFESCISNYEKKKSIAKISLPFKAVKELGIKKETMLNVVVSIMIK